MYRDSFLTMSEKDIHPVYIDNDNCSTSTTTNQQFNGTETFVTDINPMENMPSDFPSIPNFDTDIFDFNNDEIATSNIENVSVGNFFETVTV